MSRVFVTGAAGFVGRRVCERLTQRGHRVSGLQRSKPTVSAIIQGDLLVPATYEQHLAGVDTIVHLAAVTGKARPSEYFTVNVDGTRLLLEAARRTGVGRLVFFSSVAVKFPDKRRYFYAQSKSAAEDVVAQSGIAATVIRPTIVGGRGSPVLSRLATLAALPAVPAFGNGYAMIQPILADDLADFVADIVESDRFQGEVLEFGGPDVLSLRELLDRLHRLARGGRTSFIPVPLGVLTSALIVLEPLLYDFLPMTLGQLATFRFDGLAAPNDLWNARRAHLTSIDDILGEIVR